MDYIAPLNAPATADDPRPAYFDGNRQTGQEGSYPSGRALEYPMREILAVIEAAGLDPTNNDLTQLLQAINTLIATAIGGIEGGGGGGGGGFDFSLNPVFPVITVNGGVMSVATSTGGVQVGAGQTFIHRGGVLYNSSDTDVSYRSFTTVALKTYHLRWRYNGGSPVFMLADLSDPSYNPGALAETHASFDTSYDDMLIARVVTDAANTPVVTALVNRDRLAITEILAGTSVQRFTEDGTSYLFAKTLNWSRTPTQRMLSVAKAWTGNSADDDHDITMFASNLARTTPGLVNGHPVSIPVTRYGLDVAVGWDETESLHMQFMAGA